MEAPDKYLLPEEQQQRDAKIFNQGVRAAQASLIRSLLLLRQDGQLVPIDDILRVLGYDMKLCASNQPTIKVVTQ